MTWHAKNISYQEMIYSSIAKKTEINNIPSVEVVDELAKTALALQAIRSFFRKPLIVSSGFRSRELNKAVCGSKNSHHITGHAADFVVQGVSVADTVEAIPKILMFDQLINEYDRWVHLSIHPRMREQILKKEASK